MGILIDLFLGERKKLDQSKNDQIVLKFGMEVS